jgi:hypothetical protein
MSHSTGRPTKSQAVRLDSLSRMPCVCCVAEGLQQPWPTEVDHLVDKGTREHSGGHDATIPLCAWHHRGLCLNGFTADLMKAHWGPSFALQGRTAASWYGTKRELLGRVNAVIAS